MAKRPRSHQLEDESITAFRAARPSGWPVRKKDDDYGIDLEVEIFDNDENSTGLMFFVQLKATDAESGRKLVLERNYLIDICQYDTPTIIVRYFGRDGGLYWAWAADLLAQFPDGQASKVFHFDDQAVLDRSSFVEISNALVIARYLKNLPSTSPVPIRLSLEQLQGRRKLELRRFVEAIEAADNPTITFYEGGEPQLREGIVLEVGPQAVRISFGPRYTALLEIDDSMPSDRIAGRALYAICWLLKIVGLPIHAAGHAKSLLELRLRTDVRHQAVQATQCLISEPEAYVDLAILNELHALQDVEYLSVLFGLYEQPGNRAGLSRHGIRFMEAALSRAADEGSSAEGSILYSMANAARRIDIKFAYSLYLQAKRKKPEYTSISYFLREVAGCLFLLGRFQKSRELYEKSELDPNSTLDNLVLGDACLFSGEHRRAAELYNKVRKDSDVVIHSEASLKHWLSERLELKGKKYFHVSNLADSFNEGVSLAKNGKHTDALENFLTCCFIVPNDHESWINAAICCHNLAEYVLYSQLLVVGFSLEGEALLDSFMREFEKRGVDDRMYDFLSEAYATVRSIASDARQHQTRRKIEHNFDVTIPIEEGAT